jgi:hypothetical protein
MRHENPQDGDQDSTGDTLVQRPSVPALALRPPSQAMLTPQDKPRCAWQAINIFYLFIEPFDLVMLPTLSARHRVEVILNTH